MSNGMGLISSNNKDLSAVSGVRTPLLAGGEGQSTPEWRLTAIPCMSRMKSLARLKMVPLEWRWWEWLGERVRRDVKVQKGEKR